MKYDVIVAGGGISGAIAGIAAARLGVKTLIIEQYGFLGGMLTAGGVGPMMTFHAGETQVVQGITGELIERMKQKGKSTGHLFDTTGYTYTVTPFDAEGMKHELEIMFLEAGGELLYHAMLGKVVTDSQGIKEVEVITKNGFLTLSAEVYVDATGDAELAFRAGVPCKKGREEDNACQPMTMNMKMSGVDIPKVREFIKDEKNIENFSRIKEDTGIVDRSERLSIGGFEKIYARAYETGEVSFKRGEVLFFETNNPGEVIINTSRIPFPDPTDPVALSNAEVEGRKQVRELEKFIKEKIPGFERAVLIYSGPCQVGVRSSRQIEGLTVLTEQDLVSMRTFPDAIAHGGYPIDIHPPAGGYSKGFDFKKLKLPYGGIYSIPLGALVNRYVANLVTVGRCISTSFVAQGAIRVSPIAGAIGHGGGVAAGLSVIDKLKPGDLAFHRVRETLKDQGAFLL